MGAGHFAGKLHRTTLQSITEKQPWGSKQQGSACFPGLGFLQIPVSPFDFRPG